MRFETLTYQAGEFDLSLTASAPTISGRFDDLGEAVSHFTVRLWLMLSFHIVAYVAKVRATHPSARFVIKHGAEDATSGPFISVTMNRRLRRKLARLRRLGRMAAPALTVHEPAEEDTLSRGQLLDKMIRTQKWCRIRVFGLGQSRRARQLYVMRFSGLQGGFMNLRRALCCHAILSPD